MNQKTFQGRATSAGSMDLKDIAHAKEFLRRCAPNRIEVTIREVPVVGSKWKKNGVQRGPVGSSKYPWGLMAVGQVIEFEPDDFENARRSAMWWQRKNRGWRVTVSTIKCTIKRVS